MRPPIEELTRLHFLSDTASLMQFRTCVSNAWPSVAAYIAELESENAELKSRNATLEARLGNTPGQGESEAEWIRLLEKQLEEEKGLSRDE